MLYIILVMLNKYGILFLYIYILCCICLHIYNIECIYTLFVHVQKHVLYIHIQLPAENGLAGVSGVAMVFASPPFWTHQKLESQSR